MGGWVEWEGVFDVGKFGLGRPSQYCTVQHCVKKKEKSVQDNRDE